MRILLMAMLMFSCTTTAPKLNFAYATKDDIASINKSISRLSYMIANDQCLSAYGVCLGQEKKSKSECFDIHETCTVNVYNQWKKLIE
jgi:hypothetical protein